jgi:hypothetical protein
LYNLSTALIAISIILLSLIVELMLLSFICLQYLANGKEANVNRALDGSTYPGLKLVHYVFGKINYGGLKHNSLYLGLALPSGG